MIEIDESASFPYWFSSQKEAWDECENIKFINQQMVAMVMGWA